MKGRYLDSEESSVYTGNVEEYPTSQVENPNKIGRMLQERQTLGTIITKTNQSITRTITGLTQ